MASLGPQICSQCRPDITPRVVTEEKAGWGVDGDCTLYQLECGHMFLIKENRPIPPGT